VSSEPSSPGYVDPNARLLASVIPPAPPTLGARAARFITTRRSGDLRSVVRWSRSREGRACFLAALAGVALTLGFYRSESSSAASAGPTPRLVGPVTTPASSASVRSQPLALTPTATSAPTAAANERAASASAVVGDAADDPAPEMALGDASDAVPPAARKAAGAKSKSKSKSKSKGKKASKHPRKAKRQSVARGSSRAGRRAKAQRTVATGPLAAWLSTQRSKEASSSKRR
jgi:hypothetical protein